MNSKKKLDSHKPALIRKQTVKELSIIQLLEKMEIKYKNQYVIPPYIVDFFLPTKSLILEIDGSFHNKSEQSQKDSKRDDYLMSIGFFIERFSNNMLEENIARRINLYHDSPIEKRELIGRRIGRISNLAHKKNLFKNKVNNFLEIFYISDNANINRKMLVNSYKDIL